jgi:hypothetical protein
MAVSFVEPFLVGSSLGRSFTEDQARAAAVGAKIADYTLPNGYSEASAIEMFGTRMVIIAPVGFQLRSSELSMMITMMQFSSLLMDEERMRREILDTIGQEEGASKIIASETRTVRGQSVEFTVSKGTADGIPTQLMTAIFEGKGGPATITIIGAQERWNQEIADAFIESLR